jgi:Tfp pilus assembly PilM family ATPase
MADWVSVPLGIDLGATRIRVAYGQKNRSGELRICAVVSRDLPEAGATHGDRDRVLLASVLEDAVSELKTRERRCVFALGIADAAIRYVKFPKMSWAERLRAARFEVGRWPGFDGNDIGITVRVHPIDAQIGAYAVGASSSAAVSERVSLAREAGLRPVGIDHASCAFRRLLPEADAIVDIGAERTGIHTYGSTGPLCVIVDSGGSSITRGIARELSISTDVAEKRKRILGCAGAGTTEQDTLIAAISAGIERLRARTSIERVALVGNGGRLPDFASGLASATGAKIDIPVPPILDTSPYPTDVTRIAAPDWALAIGLASWSVAA